MSGLLGKIQLYIFRWNIKINTNAVTIEAEPFPTPTMHTSPVSLNSYLAIKRCAQRKLVLLNCRAKKKVEQVAKVYFENLHEKEMSASFSVEEIILGGQRGDISVLLIYVREQTNTIRSTQIALLTFKKRSIRLRVVRVASV